MNHSGAYRGRFAPSPTGPLHLGSLSAALASWLDARVHQGTWLVRIEDIDRPRERPGAAAQQLAQLARYGLVPDAVPVRQSERSHLYQDALQRLADQVYVCNCSRARVTLLDRSGAYDGHCRHRQLRLPGAIRFRAASAPTTVTDRRLGSFQQDVQATVGDFILRRRDGLWAYQLAVVVDDGEQGITQVVRGEDLFDNTPRQCLLQAALGLPRPGYLHVPLVRDEAGRKLSKHDQAPALGQQPAIRELDLVWQQLGFAPLGADTPAAFLKQAEALWAERYALNGSRKRCA